MDDFELQEKQIAAALNKYRKSKDIYSQTATSSFTVR